MLLVFALLGFDLHVMMATVCIMQYDLKLVVLTAGDVH